MTTVVKGDTAFRRGTAAEWQDENPTLPQGVPGFETDTLLIKIGDGVSNYNDLEYIGGALTGGPTGPPGEDGDDGEDGLDGNTILNGTVVPTTEGVNGDFYIRTTTLDIYGPKTVGGWGSPTPIIGPQGDAGPPGEDGEDGTNGTQGPSGINGKTVLNGTAVPTSEGVVGDFYIRTSTSQIYGPKTVVGWGSPVSLIGATGPAGTNGTNGQGVPTGGSALQVLRKINGTNYNTEWADVASGGASSLDGLTDVDIEALGSIEDEDVLMFSEGIGVWTNIAAPWYDVVDGAITTHSGEGDPHAGYQKESEKDLADGYPGLSSEGLIAPSQLGEDHNTDKFLRGDSTWQDISGLEGPQGEQGIQGVPGVDGKTWYTGSGVPSSGLGVNGDFYMRTDTHAYYTKSSGTWSLGSVLIGPAGADGTDGVDGEDGAPGPAGGTIGGAFSFTFSNTTTAPPSSSQMRFNHATHTSATRIYVSNIDTDGLDVTLGFQRVVAGYKLYVQDFDNADNYILFTVNVAGTDHGSYWEFDVTPFTSSGSSPIPTGKTAIQYIAPGTVGLPKGGTDGQVLTKTSSSDYASAWETPAAGGGGSGVPIDDVAHAMWASMSYNYEFGAAATTAPSGWTLYNSGAASGYLERDGIGTLYDKGTSGTNFRTMMKAVPSYPYTCCAKLLISHSGQASASAGFCFQNSSNRIMTLGRRYEQWISELFDYNTYHTLPASYGLQVDPLDRWVWFRITSSVYTAVHLDVSINGSYWRRLGTLTLYQTNGGADFVPDRIGIMVNSNDNYPVSCSLEWWREYASLSTVP